MYIDGPSRKEQHFQLARHLLHLEKDASQVCFSSLLTVRFSGLVSVLTQQLKSETREPNGSAAHWRLTGEHEASYLTSLLRNFLSSNKDQVAPLVRLDVMLTWVNPSSV